VIGSGGYQCSNKQLFDLNLYTGLETQRSHRLHVYLILFYLFILCIYLTLHTPIQKKKNLTARMFILFYFIILFYVFI
jgi:hypothetical protein